MAYSNWGAFVYRNGERMPNREDVGVFDEDEAGLPSGVRIFANILKSREAGEGEGQQPWWKHSHHAVLGGGKIRLCGYKASPELWRSLDDGTVERINLDPFVVGGSSDYSREWAGEIDSHKFTAVTDEDPEHVQLELTEPDGTKWNSRCGYCIGAGHED